MYLSQIRPNEVVIDPTTPSQWINAPRGRVPRNFSANPYGSLPFSAPFPKELYIDPAEWPERIKEMESTKTRLSDLIRRAQDQGRLPSKDQQQTNYCWCNAVVGAMEVIREQAGFEYVNLSPASAAAQIKGYRNEGGWGGEAVNFIGEHGINAIDEWPANYWQNATYHTQKNIDLALTRRIRGFFDIPEGDFKAVISMLLRRKPVPGGYNFWGHEIYLCDPVIFGSDQYGIRFRNSWGGSWGDIGFGVLKPEQANPNDAQAIWGVAAYSST